MKILFLIRSCKKYSASASLLMDRVDLTRRLDAINTWVQDALYEGHDVLFYDGGNETEYYDEQSKTLHLVENDDYDTPGLPSPLIIKTQAAFRWILENKEFERVFLINEDYYTNLKELLKTEVTTDFLSGPYGTGSGYFFNKKAMKCLVEFKNVEGSFDDIIILQAMASPSITSSYENYRVSNFYFPGELYGTIHYASGKRAYFLHNIVKFYQENGYTNRKIILFFPLNSYAEYDIVSYESTLSISRKSKRWYDFTTDPNGWEYHGGYARSTCHIEHLFRFWPYAQNSAKYFVINFNEALKDYKNNNILYEKYFKYLIEKCEYSLINKNNLLLSSDKDENIDGWVIDNSLKDKLKLNFENLNTYNFYVKK